MTVDYFSGYDKSLNVEKHRSSESSLDAILHNEPIDNTLYVIVVISNVCGFKRRWQLAKEFLERLKKFKNIDVYICELIYGTQEYQITEENNPKHLQLWSDCVLWEKECQINLVVKKLLPKNWKAMAWIDADLEFESPNWVIDTLKLLKTKDICQLFSHADDMDKQENTMRIYKSFCYQQENGKNYYKAKNQELFHPGYAWAITREAYDKMGGLYELSILGSGDNNMALALIGNGNSVHKDNSEGYKNSIIRLVPVLSEFNIGYVPTVIRHHFHGTKENRRYMDRWRTLVKYRFDPNTHVEKNSDGLLVFTKNAPTGLKRDIVKYFWERKEDD